MTEQEKRDLTQEIVQSVLQSLKSNSVSISQLTEVQGMPESAYIELDGGRKIMLGKLRSYIQTAIMDNAVYPAISTIGSSGGGEASVVNFNGVVSGDFNLDTYEILLKNAAGTVLSVIDLKPIVVNGRKVDDMSNFELLEGYINNELVFKKSTTAGYITTGYIWVNPGDVVVFTGQRSSGLPSIVGYSDNLGNDATILLGSTSYTDSTLRYTEEVVVIPSDREAPISFIRCQSIKEGTGSPSAPAMSVVIHRENINTEVTEVVNEGSTTIIENPAVRLAKTVFVPHGKKIMLCGGWFSAEANGWDKLLEDMTGVEVVNKSYEGGSIRNVIISRILDASASKPHGSLFWSSSEKRDTFYDYGAIIICCNSDKDVLLDEAVYKSRSLESYKEDTSWNNESDYASCWDFVIKQLKAWGSDSQTAELKTTYNGGTYTYTDECAKNQVQILVCSHWNPGLKTFNDTSRKLAVRHNVAYCELDNELGFSEGDEVFATLLTDQNKTTPKEGWYNRSVLHSQFVYISNGAPGAKTIKKDNKTWGLNVLRASSTIDFGYGKITKRNGDEVYLPWIQLAIATAVAKCIRHQPFVITEYENPWVDMNASATPAESETPKEWIAIREERYYYNGEIGNRNQIISLGLQDDYLESITTGAYAYPLSADNLYLRLNSAVENGKVPILKAKLKRPNGTYVDVLITMFKDENDIFTGTQELSNGYTAEATVSQPQPGQINGTQKIIYSLNQ